MQARESGEKATPIRRRINKSLGTVASRANEEESCWGPRRSPMRDTKSPPNPRPQTNERTIPASVGGPYRTYRGSRRRWRDLLPVAGDGGGPTPCRGDVGDVAERDALLGLRGRRAGRLGSHPCPCPCPGGGVGHRGALGGGGGRAARCGEGGGHRETPRSSSSSGARG
jgi:hypothetical protein